VLSTKSSQALRRGLSTATMVPKIPGDSLVVWFAVAGKKPEVARVNGRGCSKKGGITSSFFAPRAGCWQAHFLATVMPLSLDKTKALRFHWRTRHTADPGAAVV
jgi:hypothetical protein